MQRQCVGWIGFFCPQIRFQNLPKLFDCLIGGEYDLLAAKCRVSTVLKVQCGQCILSVFGIQLFLAFLHYFRTLCISLDLIGFEFTIWSKSSIFDQNTDDVRFRLRRSRLISIWCIGIGLICIRLTSTGWSRVGLVSFDIGIGIRIRCNCTGWSSFGFIRWVSRRELRNRWRCSYRILVPGCCSWDEVNGVVTLSASCCSLVVVSSVWVAIWSIVPAILMVYETLTTMKCFFVC